MPHEDFIKSLDDSISEKGYANIVKRLRNHLAGESDARKKVAIEREIRTILDGTGKYQFLKVSDGEMIFKNPNYAFQHDIQQTNNSIRSLNYFQKWMIGASVFIAAVTTLFIILSYFEQKNDKNRAEIGRLEGLMQTQSQTIKNLLLSLKEINSSIEKLTNDSISVRLIK